MFPMGSKRRLLLNQSTHSRVANSTASKLRPLRDLRSLDASFDAPARQDYAPIVFLFVMSRSQAMR
jgi:hypothetical protein